MPLDCLRRTVGGVEEVGVLGPRVLHAVLILQEGLSHAAPLHLPPEPREDVDYRELTLGQRHPIRCIFCILPRTRDRSKNEEWTSRNVTR